MKSVLRSFSFLLTFCLLLSVFPAIASFAHTPEIRYAFSDALPGSGQGQITLSGLSGSGYFSLYFTDDSGVLQGYEPIVSRAQTGAEASVPLPVAFLLPEGASGIALYESATKTPADLSLSAAAARVELPDEKRLSSTATFTFASVSDAHLNYDDNGYGASAKWTAALNFFEQAGMDYVILSGDITGSGTVTEYERYAAATAVSAFPAQRIYEAQGNHDATQVARFLSYTSGENEEHPFEGSAWYSVLFEGKDGARDNLFIFMAQELSSTSGTPTTDNFSKRQLDWVEGLLKSYAGTETNLFLVEHAMIHNFGPGDKYDGVYVEPMYFADQFPGNLRFKSLLTEYKEAVLMTGHTHLSLYEGYNYSDENGTAARMIHNSSTSQPRCYTSSGTISYNSEGRTNQTEGSEGYLVYVYEDAVCYVGYNLTTGQAIPTASYRIPLYSEDRSAAVSIEITTPPAKTEYAHGEWFDGSGMVVTATFADGSTSPVAGWGCSNVGSLSAEDPKVLITYGDCDPVEVTLTVGAAPSKNGEGILQGDGTAEDPFLIGSAADFAALTSCFNACTSTSDICGSGFFYKQTADIDMTGFEGYEGTHANGNAKCYFGGVYNGDGHTLKVDLTCTGQTSIFPYIYGTIYNLKIEGKIYSPDSAQPIRTIQTGAVVANCLIDMTLKSSNANGVCYTNYGTVYNVYITGVATHAAHSSNSGKYYNAYAYVKSASGSLLTTSVAEITNDLEVVVTGLADRESTNAQNGLTALHKNSPALSEASLGAVTLKDGVLLLSSGSSSDLPIIKGSGTTEDPFLIGTPAEFNLLTDYFNASVSSSSPYGQGQVFLQTADIDMTGFKGYEGTHANGNAKCYFGGIYDGGGHTLKVDVNASGQTSVFPYLYGAILNLKIEGKIYSPDSAQPIRTIQTGAVVANCLIDMTLKSSNANGVCYTNYGTVYNVYITGVATHAAHSSNSGKYYNAYAYVKSASGSLLTTSVAEIMNDLAHVVAAFSDKQSADAKNGLAALAAKAPSYTTGALLPVFAGDGTIEFGRLLPKGDVNRSGAVNINDVTELLNLLSFYDGSDFDPYADVNADGAIDIGDVTELLNVLAGKG